MQKFWTILLAVLLATGLVFVGCDSSSSKGPEVDDGSKWYNVLANEENPLVLEVEDNFLYGDGYQGQIMSAALFDGKKVLKDGTYWLKVTFTASRDLEDALWAGLVDTVTDYWNPLTWDGDDKDDDGTLIAPTSDSGVYADGSDKDYIIKKDVEISGLFKFVALKTAPDAALDKNVLNFQTEGEGTKGTKGSGKEGDFTITFTEFVFAKDVEYDEEEAGKAPITVTIPPVTIDLTNSAFLTANTSFWAASTVDGYTGIMTNATASAEFAKAYNGAVTLDLNLGKDFVLADYAFIAVLGTWIDANGDPLDNEDSTNWVGVKITEDGATVADFNNFGFSWTGGTNIGGAVIASGLTQAKYDGDVEDITGEIGLSFNATPDGASEVDGIVITQIKFYN